MTIDPYRDQLTQQWNRESDPSILVYDRLMRWKGQPRFRYGARPKQGTEGINQAISTNFTICTFQQNPLFSVFCTVGAAYSVIPKSTQTSGDPRGIRHEYMMHAPAEYDKVACEMLLMIAEFPHVHNIEIGPGYVIPIGEPIVPGSRLEYLYLTYPFLDDAHIYDANPAGEIDHPQAYIQTLWVVPLTRGERQYLQQHGVEKFEEFLHSKHAERYDADFGRASLVDKR